VETSWRRKDGGIIDVLLSTAPIVPGDLSQGVVFTALDITAMKKSREAQTRLATAVEQAEEIIEITDVTGAIQYVNPAFERTTGFSQSEVIGRNPNILQSGEHGEAFYQDLWATIKGGKVWKGRFINRTKDGAILHEDAVISPVRDSRGSIVNFVAVKRDVTQELALQQQLLHAQKMEAIGILAGGIAHDFNNLLQVTSGFSELLLAGKDESDPEYKDLMKILRAARNGADLVQRLLTFSRKVEPAPVPLNLNRQVHDVERLLRRTIPKMIAIELDLSDDVSNIFADPTQMEQLLMNLALNARDAMPEGGILRMVTRNVTLDRDFCSSYVGVKPGQYVALTVSDTGHGMDAETLNHIFEPFYTTKELGRGTGLGLAMVYGIVKQHDGLIVCQSSTGEGTSFHVYLPTVEAAVETTAYLTQELPAFGSETLLVVDDETAVRELGRRFLEKAGYSVLTAADGNEALTMFRKERERIALVVLDLIMPGMGGMECLRELIKIDPAAKVLVASGHADDQSREQAFQLGARAFVRKPYVMTSLLQQVRRALDKS
jgi:PAS domain S-box-containing protein